MPSFADTWGWVIVSGCLFFLVFAKCGLTTNCICYLTGFDIEQASDQPLCIDAGKMDMKIAERIEGELLYLNGATFVSSTILNKTVAKT